jgi:hypothetical protein
LWDNHDGTGSIADLEATRLPDRKCSSPTHKKIHNKLEGSVEKLEPWTSREIAGLSTKSGVALRLVGRVE